MNKLKLLFVVFILSLTFTACDTITSVEVHEDMWAFNNVTIDIGSDYRLDSLKKTYNEENDRYTVIINFEKIPNEED